MTTGPRLSDVTAIVVTYNSAHCMLDLMRGLAPLQSVTVVDNGSADGTPAAVSQARPDAKVISLARNVGFGAANNRALREVKTPYALLINPDCLPTDQFLAGMIDGARQFPEAAMLAPHLVRRNDTIELSYRWPARLWQSRGPQAAGPCCVGFVCGAAMLLNMERMRSVGFFDETFFLYYEDEDLCERVFRARLPIVLLPSVQLKHLSRGSVKGPSPLKSEYLRGFHHAQSKLVFERKYYGARQAARLRWRTLVLAIFTLIPRLLLPSPRYLARLVGRIAGLCRPVPLAAPSNQP